MTVFNPAAEAINKHNLSIDNYLNSDPRLQKSKDLLAPKIDVGVFNKLINAAKGVREIHYVDYNGTQIPMRLLSMAEERKIKHETHMLFKKYPEFIGGENHPEFAKIELIKTLSRATSSAPELYDMEQPDPFLTEDAVDNMPTVAFNFLLSKYQILQKEYDITYNREFDEEINEVLLFLFDGGEFNEKKLALLSGLTSQQKSQIIIRFWNVLTRLEDNARFITLLEELNQKETEETSNA